MLIAGKTLAQQVCRGSFCQYKASERCYSCSWKASGGMDILFV